MSTRNYLAPGPPREMPHIESLTQVIRFVCVCVWGRGLILAMKEPYSGPNYSSCTVDPHKVSAKRLKKWCE